VTLAGVKGTEAGQTVAMWEPGVGDVVGATLRPHVPTVLMLVVALDREALPPGPHDARAVLRDHLGHRHRSPKVTFQDAHRAGAGGAAPSPASDGGPVDHGGDG
jgi:hypothetical protein